MNNDMNNNSQSDGSQNSNTLQLTRRTHIILLWGMGVSLFWIVFLWGFWEKGVYALGINAFVFFILTISLFFWVMHHEKTRTKDNLTWIIPIGFIILSFILYDNPFLKVMSLMVLPVLFVLFYNYSLIAEKGRVYWNIKFLFYLIARFFSFMTMIRKSMFFHLNFISSSFAKLDSKLLSNLRRMNLIGPETQKLAPERGLSSKRKKGVVKRVVFGVILFLVIALTVVIPLLSSADSVFALYMEEALSLFHKFISITFIYKLLVFVILSLVITASLLAWGKLFSYSKDDELEKKVDPIITGIILGGTLILYLLFLWIQVKQLWVGSLPFDFKETEHLVKSGFWQLFFLSIINIVIYFFTYRKTALFVQKILTIFTVASLLLLASAGHRMGLYVTSYGLSYEKFFASYTVVFCAILFVWMITRMYVRHRADIVKFVILLFLWMYAFITVFPVEQFIFRSNIALAQRENTRIRLYELTMLSPDVLKIVKKFEKEGKLKEPVEHYGREVSSMTQEGIFDWSLWIKDQEKRVRDKAWYEENIVNILY